MPRNITVVVPCFNSEKSLPLLIPELLPVLANYADNYEVILVNDGSRDKTLIEIQGLVDEYAFTRGINLTKNFGQHNATLCGICQAKYDVVVTIDDDLQNPPEEIIRLVDKLEEGYDVVYGVPTERNHTLIRNMGSHVLRFILKAIGAKSSEGISSFRALRSFLAEGLADSTGQVVCLDVLFSWTTENFATLSVKHRARTRAQSSYTLTKLVKVAFDLIISYSSLPLKLVGISGLVSVTVGLILFSLSVISWLGLVAAIPNGLLASCIFIVGGLQLAGLGIVGEYLIRLHSSAVKQPPFRIAEELSSQKCETVNTKLVKEDREVNATPV